LDATLRLTTGTSAALALEEWERLLSSSISINPETRRFFNYSKRKPSKIISSARKVLRSVRAKETPDFAFVVHALSQADLFRAPGARMLQNLPVGMKNNMEKIISKAPGFTYGHIRHVISEKNNREVNGIIYALMATPKMMKNEEPEVTYAKIEKLCQHAADQGAKIIGLGAYTKVVGDSGATINRNSPIPVTTGNSLSASATLWAVAEASRKMNLKPIDFNSGLIDATGMVIGATGSIGKVSAKLLCMVFKKLILVAPRIERLNELADEIRKINPLCEVVPCTDANAFASECDVLVTATSALDQKIVDVMLLKPGCIVCDCSRPLDFTTQDALARPQLLSNSMSYQLN
jgi:predicted amino acid dehydrogenase